MLKNFLSSKFTLDGEYLEKLSSDEFDPINIKTSETNKSLDKMIRLELQKMEEKFNRKYNNHDTYAIRKTMMKKQNK